MTVFSAWCQASEAAQLVSLNLDCGKFTLQVPCHGDQFGLSILQIGKLIIIEECRSQFHVRNFLMFLEFMTRKCKKKGKITTDSFLNALD